jgi:hypothetical protein
MKDEGGKESNKQRMKIEDTEITNERRKYIKEGRKG